MDRLFPWVHLAALGLGAAGVGFGAYIYQVPWKAQNLELKRRTGELRSVRNEAAARLTELNRLKQELAEAQAARRVTEDGRRKTELRVIQAALEDRLKHDKVSVQVRPRAVRVRFSEDVLFDARGPMITRDGQAMLQVIAELVVGRAVSVMISAPMAGAQPPKWTRGEYPNAADLSTARARAALRVLLRSGVRSDVAFAVVGGDGASDADEPSLDVEVEPRS
jgi:flagellar motor protein MotB